MLKCKFMLFLVLVFAQLLVLNVMFGRAASL